MARRPDQRQRLLPAPPAFFLADGGTPARLLPEDAQHAVRVMRLGVGDLLLGLDGRGARHPLRIRALHRSELELEPAGPVELLPAPGEEGSPLPWFELAISWPRKVRVEAMLGRLVQLGVAAIRPLIALQRGPEEVHAEAPARLQRVVREACKQAGRAWLPSFEPALATSAFLRAPAPGALAALDPRAGLPFDMWLRSLQPSPQGIGTRARPIVLAVGPEGGWSADEERAFLDANAALTWLGPYVLRVETAAEAAMAVAAAVHGRSALREPSRAAPDELE